MRDVQTERECGVGLPVGVTLGELRAAAAVIFGYNRNRWREVRIEYPALGIEEYDKTEDSVLTELASESAWAEVGFQLCAVARKRLLLRFDID